MAEVVAEVVAVLVVSQVLREPPVVCRRELLEVVVVMVVTSPAIPAMPVALLMAVVTGITATLATPAMRALRALPPRLFLKHSPVVLLVMQVPLAVAVMAAVVAGVAVAVMVVLVGLYILIGLAETPVQVLDTMGWGVLAVIADLLPVLGPLDMVAPEDAALVVIRAVPETPEAPAGQEAQARLQLTPLYL